MDGLSRYFSRAFVLGRSFSKAVDNSVVQNLDYSLRIVIITVNRGYLRQNWDIFRNRKILSSISRTVICDSRDGMYGQIVTQG